MSISSDEINFLIYRYLQENGFSHSAFSFAYESLVIKSSVVQTEIPPGALITFLQKGLEYIAIEEHINEDGSVKDFENNYTLLSPMICEAVAVKEDRRYRAGLPTSASEASGDSSGVVPMEEVTTDVKAPLVVNPPVIQLMNEASTRYLHLGGHKGEVFMCVWNPVMNQLASGSADGVCRLWGLWEMNKERWNSKQSEITLNTAVMPHAQWEGERYKDVTSVTWSPDGQSLATGCYDGTARIWSNQGVLKITLKEHTGPVFALKWSKSGTHILSGSYDRRVIVWNSVSGSIIKIYNIHSAPVLDVDWKDTGDNFASCSSDKTIQIYQLSAAGTSSVKSFSGHQNEVNAVCWSPNGALIASCSDDHTAKIWTQEEGLKFDLVAHEKEIFTLRWTPTGPGSSNPEKKLYLCTASFDGTVKVWSSVNGELVYSLSNQAQPVYSLAPSPNGDYIATGSLGGNVSIWSLAKGELIRDTLGSGDTFDVSWSKDGSLLCACFSSGTLYIFDTTS